MRRSAAVPVSLDKPIPAPQSRKQTRHLLIVSYLGSEVDETSRLSTLSFSKPVGFGSIPPLNRWRPARTRRRRSRGSRPTGPSVRAHWLPTDNDRWHAYLGCDEDLDEAAELVFYCPACAEREFGGV